MTLRTVTSSMKPVVTQHRVEGIDKEVLRGADFKTKSPTNERSTLNEALNEALIAKHFTSPNDIHFTSTPAWSNGVRDSGGSE